MNDIRIAKWVIFDAEGDGLKPTKFWCVSFTDYLGQVGTLTDYTEIRKFFKCYDTYIGHNIIRWDLPELMRVIEVDEPESVIDTLAVSWYLDPRRKRHGLESFGEELGVLKKVILDWSTQDLSDYIDRCETDVEINRLLWERQLEYLVKLYPDPKDLWSFLRYLRFKMECARLAEESGWKLDVQKCQENLKLLCDKRDIAFEALGRAMPEVPSVSYRQPPKRSVKSDGSLSLLGIRWQKLLESQGLPPDYEGVVEEITGYEPGNPASHVQLKDWLYSLGWIPQTIKHQRDKDTGKIKEIPQIYTEHEKEICPSIEKLFDVEPALEHLDNLGVLNHRISVLSGFLRDAEDGILHARVAGLTNTMRFKHAELVNMPKPEKKYGEYIRSVLIAFDDHELCGSDMASLEDRLKQHFIFKFDPDYVRQLNEKGYDPHLKIAVLAGMMTDAEVEEYKRINRLLEKDETKKDVSVEEKGLISRLKPKRSIAKNGNYACQYNAQIARLMITCGIDREAATKLFNAYWELNWAITAVVEEQVIKTVNDQMWLLNPISGFWYSLRNDRDVFSTLIQGSASYCFDLWGRIILSKRRQVTAQFHDEFVFMVRKGFRKEIEEFLNETIKEANEALGLNRELGISVQFGDRYSEIH